MLKNECSRNCWLAGAVAGLLVWIFNGTFFGGLALGLITFLLLGSLLRWLICEGRGGVYEDSEVLTAKPTHPAHEDEGGILERAEQAVVDAGAAIASGAVAAVEKGREAMRDMTDDDDDDDDDRTRDREDDRKDRAARKDRDDDDDDDDSLLERAEDRLEQAGDAVKEAMGAIAARGKQAISSLTSNDDRDEKAARDGEQDRAERGAASPAAFHAPQAAEPDSGAGDPSDHVSPSGVAAIPPKKTDAEDVGTSKADKPAAATDAAATQADTKTQGAEQSSAAEKPEPAKPSQAATSTQKPAAAPKTAKADDSTGDDLKEIKGIGPQLEKFLHDNGVTSFAEIAGWSEADIDSYAEKIGRGGGRIRSDEWVEQAKLLAKGGSTEFSRRVDKGEVY
ncbi:hypothetical protein [Paracoccus sediminicola]|uniref:hypothetical protein n=1 Tax=Paracoccus sediminicola TaxID=3017783 RepID=UPI0022F05FA7|nr:hypothetical protein [Paracoccus sediminicola]WBU57027.1 hypothetical protein PAF18_00850 [Paracoccus sediminicola]